MTKRNKEKYSRTTQLSIKDTLHNPLGSLRHEPQFEFLKQIPVLTLREDGK